MGHFPIGNGANRFANAAQKSLSCGSEFPLFKGSRTPLQSIINDASGNTTPGYLTLPLSPIAQYDSKGPLSTAKIARQRL